MKKLVVKIGNIDKQKATKELNYAIRNAASCLETCQLSRKTAQRRLSSEKAINLTSSRKQFYVNLLATATREAQHHARLIANAKRLLTLLTND